MTETPEPNSSSNSTSPRVSVEPQAAHGFAVPAPTHKSTGLSRGSVPVSSASITAARRWSSFTAPRYGGGRAMIRGETPGAGLRETLRSFSGVVVDQPAPQREPDQPGHVADTEPFHQLSAMRLDRLDADLEPRGDGLRRVAFRDELQDLALARRQPLERGAAGCAICVALEDVFGDRGGEIRLTARHLAQAAL